MNKISAIINTYNEEKNITSCLRSIKWVDEIVVVDMDSTDNTIQYVKKYTNKIYYQKHSGYVESARNFAIKHTTGNWILVIDADEEVRGHSNQIIKNLVNSINYDGYLFPRRNYLDNKIYLKHGYFYPDYQLRLFRNTKKIKYSGMIHEQPKMNNNRIKIVNDVIIYHNSSHSKYNSFVSILRFFPYIKVEGEIIANSKISTANILLDAIIEPLRHFYRSFIKLKGYKEGYIGFRAALLYGLYKGLTKHYACLLRNKLLK